MKVLFVSAVLVLADQVSKTIVVKTMSLNPIDANHSISVIQNFFHFTYITNDGMAFGINFPFGYYIFTSVSILLTLFLFWYLWSVRTHSIVIRLGISFIIAGAIVNLIDRIRGVRFNKSTLVGCVIEKKDSFIIISKEPKVKKMPYQPEK